jgi:vancomycin resistance protein YoaR
MRRVLRAFLAALLAAAGLVLIVVIAWGIDLRAHDGKVLRNVKLANHSIGGMTTARVDAIAAAVAKDFEGAHVRVSTASGGFSTDANTLGVSVSQPATVEAAFAYGRSGAVPARLWAWARSFVVPDNVRLRVRVDRAAVYAVVRAKDPGPRTEPTEPSLRWSSSKSKFEVTDGKDGNGIDAASVLDALPTAAAQGPPFVVQVTRGKVAPRWSKAEMEALATRAEALVSTAVAVRAGDATATVPIATARSWVRSSSSDAGLQLTFDAKTALDDLDRLLPSAGTPAQESSFVVEAGAVRIIEGAAGTKCCEAGAVARLERRLLDPREASSTAGPVDLPLGPRPPNLSTEQARALGIVQSVATFTTNHKAGEPRVTNIHLIADLARGKLIEPGKTFSVNKSLGKRTADKGFVMAPVIENGVHGEDIGGGVSQFATTLFNAAFFAGLDYGEYQSHSLYISRYPYGREATMGFPHPDLQIVNRTPYGVLIWPTYDATSLTITLYSTTYVTAVQSAQTKSTAGKCTRVATERTRTYVDGRTAVDKVYALYQPAEGVNC